jgi:hypothetical protein
MVAATTAFERRTSEALANGVRLNASRSSSRGAERMAPASSRHSRIEIGHHIAPASRSFNFRPDESVFTAPSGASPARSTRMVHRQPSSLP